VEPLRRVRAEERLDGVGDALRGGVDCLLARPARQSVMRFLAFV